MLSTTNCVSAQPNQGHQKQIVKTIIREQGYAIVEFDFDLTTEGISKETLTLPVKLSLDKQHPYNYALAKVANYDHEHMPAWCKYLSYPLTPPATFESNTYWEEHDDDPEYEGEWCCCVYLYTQQPTSRPDIGVYLDLVDEVLFLYELTCNNYYCYIQDADGERTYHDIKFRYYHSISEEVEWADVIFDNLILLPISDVDY